MADIVLIEDDPSFRRVLAKMLIREGHAVREAADGSDGVALCRGRCPDLVITDMVMPDQEGMETILQLGREYPGLPVLAISGCAHATLYLDAATSLGAAASLPKPFTKLELFDAVAALLRRRNEREQTRCE